MTRTAWCMKNRGSFEDHVGPSIHSGGPVPLGQKPLRSLRKLVSHNSRVGPRTQSWSPSPRDYGVDAGMNPLHRPVRTTEELGRQRQTYRNRLRIGLKSYKITLEIVHRIIYVLLGHSRVDHQVCQWRRSRRVTGEYVNGVGEPERIKRVVSPDSVRAWIRQHYVFESTSRDLIIIGGITPGTDAGRW